MLLLLTTSGDGTCNLISEALGDFVFRYNFDQISEYKAFITGDEFSIINPVGKSISNQTAKTVFFWKAFSAIDETQDRYIISEAKYYFLEIYNWFETNGKIKGNRYDFHNRCGKFKILSIAKKYFQCPASVYSYALLRSDIAPKANRITKSLSSSLMSNGKTLFTTDVSNRELDPKYPWFLQEKIESDFDVTIFTVNGNFFAFERDRQNLNGLDWRAEQTFEIDKKEWFAFKLSQEMIQKLEAICNDLNVDWGRFDFMRDKSGNLIFLEYNANGQFVFLDYHNSHGIMDAVIEYLVD